MARTTRADDPNARGLIDLFAREGPPLTITELARMIGMSATFVREEIKAGHLRAVQIGRGRKRVFRIPVPGARAYAQAIGLHR